MADKVPANLNCWPGHFESRGHQFLGSSINTGGGNVQFAASGHVSTVTVSVHARFKVTDYEGQKNSNPDRVQDTCQWVLQDNKYRQWYDGEIDSLLWISADPGCGKSVLSKSLIENELKCTDSLSCCYYFFKDHKQPDNLLAALCSLLHQLFILKPELIRHAELETERNGERLQRESLLLWRLLIVAATDPAAGNVVCVLDALDECKEQDRYILITLLKDFYNQSNMSTRTTTLKFLVTSRPYDSINIRFREIVDIAPEIHLRGEKESRAISQEIQLVIKSEIEQIARERVWKAQVRKEVETKLLGIHNRTYLWLFLILEEIRATFDSTKKKLSKLIDELPDSAHNAYERVLARSENKAEARKILQIVIAAFRPLTLEELYIVLAIKDDTRSHKDLDIEENDHIERRIRNTCGLFLSVSDGKVYLIHQTAKEFLIATNSVLNQNSRTGEWKHSFNVEDCNYVLVRACIRYLSLEDFENNLFIDYILERYTRSQYGGILAPLKARFQFLDYCASQWGAHVRKVRLDDVDEIIFRELCNGGYQRCKIWSVVYQDNENLGLGSVTGYSSLQIACLLGVQQVAAAFIREGASVDFGGSDCLTALQIASAAGHLDIVLLLLQKGAQVNATNVKYGTALRLASQYGHADVVEALLETGAAIESRTEKTERALILAAREGHEEVLTILLKDGARLSTNRQDFGDALCAAAHKGHAIVTRNLLDYAPALGTGVETYEKVLKAGCMGGHEKVVELLLRICADYKLPSRSYVSALSETSRQGNDKIVERLLALGADVNTYGGYYGYPLQAASYYGHTNVIEQLLRRGANVNAQGGKYGNALYASSIKGHQEVVQILLDKGADIDAQNKEYGNALYAASLKGYREIVQQLLCKGADVNAQGGKYGSALQAASYQCHYAIVQLLLTQGADVNAQSREHGSALYISSFQGDRGVVQQLLTHDADVNVQGGMYGNALQAASYQGQLEIVRLLLSKGADINAPGGSYYLNDGADVNVQSEEHGNALYISCCRSLPVASMRRHLKIVEQLLDQGADVNVQGGMYGNALQAASYQGQLGIVQLLLSKGADINAPGGRYGNALQAASHRGHQRIVQLLQSEGADANI